MANRLLEISKKILDGFKRNGDMVVTLSTIEEFKAAIAEAEKAMTPKEYAEKIMDRLNSTEGTMIGIIANVIDCAVLAEREACVRIAERQWEIDATRMEKGDLSYSAFGFVEETAKQIADKIRSR